MFWSQHLGCWGQNTSRIQNKGVYATLCLQAHAKSRFTVDQANRYINSYIGLDPRFRYVAAQFAFCVGDLDATLAQLKLALQFDMQRVRNTTHASTAFHASIDAIVAMCKTQLSDLERVAKFKLKASNDFAAEKFRSACQQYSSALLALEAVGNPKPTKTVNPNPKLAARLHFNKALCMSRINQIGGAIAECDVAIKLDPKYAKAIHKRGKLFHGRKEYTGHKL